MSEAWQKRWGELVASLLRVKAPPAAGGEEETALATTLAGLSQCCSRPRLLHDYRQFHCVVEKCVSIVEPHSDLVRHAALLLASLLRSSLTPHLPGATVPQVVAWLGEALRHQGGKEGQPDTVYHLLRALAAALRNISSPAKEVYLSLAGSRGCLPHTLESSPAWHNKALAMQCLHLLTYVGPEVVIETKQRGDEVFPAEMVSSIQRIVIAVVQQDPPNSAQCSHRLYLHLVASALSGLYNLVVCAPGQVLGNIIVTACRPFAFYGLPGYSHGDLVDPCPTPPLDLSLSSTQDSDSSNRVNYTNRNRRKRLRRKRAQPSRSTPDCNRGVIGPPLGGVAVGGMGLGLRGAPPATALANISLKPEWTKGRSQTENQTVSPPPSGSEGEETQGTSSPVEPLVSGSETDFSDFEGGGEKETALMARVRQCSLQAINAVIDKVGKQHKFSYWPPLMCQNPSLMTCVLRDPSLSVRMAALQVINTFLLDSSKVLTLAVESGSESKSSYTTLGHQLGVSLRELHRCLALALLSEKFPSALVRTLKTIELLVENVNYSKLQPGLLSKLVTHVKYFMRYREAVVRANAFSVMVSVLMIKPQVEELRDLLLRYQTPALTAPPAVLPPPSMEEEVPGDEEEEEEGDANLKKEMEKLNFLSEGEEEACHGGRKTMVSWLVGRCVDSLIALDHEAVRGIYIQVQLQSLKVLCALVGEHLTLILPSLPLIQRVITVCSEAVREPLPLPPPHHPLRNPVNHSDQQPRRIGEVGDGGDASLSSPDPGAVVEHTYTLLGCLLGAVKNDLERKTEPSLSLTQAQQLWLWALQGPLQILLTQAASGHEGDAVRASPVQGPNERCEQGSWRDRQMVRGMDNSEGSLKQMVAVAMVFSHFSSELFESLGEVWAGRVTSTVHWLVTHPEAELRLSGVRAMAIMVAFPGVVASPGSLALLQATVEAACDLLAQRDANVNKDRLLASWALANVSSVFELYKPHFRESWDGSEHTGCGEVLSLEMAGRLLEVGLRACQDKDKIRPHGVRCIGNVTRFLRPQQVGHAALAPLVARTVNTLVTCAGTGNNMKTRWNACHALGNIMSSGSFPTAIAPWRSQVFSTLGCLVESFKNYKVRIQACSALCAVGGREEYGTEYFGVWRALLRGLDNAQNIVDYQEIRHRDELINQICQGICQLCVHLTLEDAGSLCELLQVHQDEVGPLMQKAYLSLPPERSAHALKAQHQVEELLGCDALTEAQQQALLILENLTSPSPTT